MADQQSESRSLVTRCRADRGAVTLYVAMIFLIFLFMVALISDGGTIRGERRNAGDMAQRAGRIASQEVDVAATVAQGETVLDNGAAINAAEAYITANGGQPSVTTQNGNEIVVTVTIPVDLDFFPDRVVSATRVVGAISE